MQDYVIFTDTGADMPGSILKKYDIREIPLKCFMKDEPEQTVELRGKAFYDALREGKVACTSAANISVFRDAFTEVLKQGKDILYITISSGLSCMSANGRLAADELMEEYPDRKIRVVDSLGVTLGEALLCQLTAEKRAAGLSLDEAAAYAEENKLCMTHWFTVEDLVYLKRGGRLSAVSAFAGTLLGIKPLITVDTEGKLDAVEKQRGRNNSILSLLQHYDTECADRSVPVYIAHADALETAEQLSETLIKEHGVKETVIGELGPIIGAHTGPGLIGLFFFGAPRA